jgi:hypothetical protein
LASLTRSPLPLISAISANAILNAWWAGLTANGASSMTQLGKGARTDPPSLISPAPYVSPPPQKFCVGSPLARIGPKPLMQGERRLLTSPAGWVARVMSKCGWKARFGE